MTQYLIHKAVEFDKVKSAVRKEWGVGSVDDLSGRFMAQPKFDGCNAIMKLHQNAAFDEVVSRTGEVVKSIPHLIKEARAHFRSRLLRAESIVVLGEVWRPCVEFPAISGQFRRHAAVPELEFKAFDLLDLSEFTSRSNRPFAIRYDRLCHYLWQSEGKVQLAGLYHAGTYGSAQQFCNQLVAKGGYDGAILRDPSGLWVPGNGTDGEIIKVKASQSVDLEVIAVEEGKGKYKGTLGALVCRGPKGHVKVSGMSDAQRAEWWGDVDYVVAPPIIGKIVQVDCLGFTSAGSLREPRFKGIRYDKEQADY